MYLFPPRPEKVISRDLIPIYQEMGFFAEIKANGTCTVIEVDNHGKVTFWSRHKELLKAWTPTQECIQYFSKYKDSTIIAELLHSKTKTVKNTFYIFDVLVFKGRDLIGTTRFDRMKLILENFNETSFIWSFKSFNSDKTNFSELFEQLEKNSDDEVEGLVFKNPTGILKPCFREGTNGYWQVKCRFPTKMYSC